MHDLKDTVIYEPDLGLEGTIPELVRWANNYTSDYSDPALLRISELAQTFRMDEKYVQIPLLLKDERFYEESFPERSAYARMKIDHYLDGKISYNKSNYGTDGIELEVSEMDGNIVISLSGSDDDGLWNASNVYTMEKFMSGAIGWLDTAIGETLYYGKAYEEVTA
ncbi:MAG: hypothetical protein IJI51_03535 [Lachnospiraceae bacterium]|nr:hypothetical protein [Lachnospiraceae bacterium]